MDLKKKIIVIDNEFVRIREEKVCKLGVYFVGRVVRELEIYLIMFIKMVCILRIW